MSRRAAASTLIVMPSGEAVWILRECEVRRPRTCWPQWNRAADALVRSMDRMCAADILSRATPAAIAAILDGAPAELRKHLMFPFAEQFRALGPRSVE